jgi:N-carbamoylputrescine amidase
MKNTAPRNGRPKSPRRRAAPAAPAASQTVHVGLTQMACSDDARENLAKQSRLIERAAKAGAQIICTQEMYRSQYFCQVEDHRFFKVAETIPGPSTDAFTKLAKKHKVVIIASLFEKRAHGLYHNTAVVIDADGSILGLYRKMHIPDDPLYYEKFYFTPGDTGFRAWDTKYAKIGVLICWDQWFPEGARLTALQGADVLLYPTAIGWDDAESGSVPAEEAKALEARHLDAWVTAQRAHAIANGIFVAAANRVGREGHLRFWGNSFIAGPGGEIVARMDSESEGVILADVDPKRAETERRTWPFLRDRRVDAYGGMTGRGT